VEVILTEIQGLLLFKPKIYKDIRGSFYETWRCNKYKEAGISEDFQQDSISISAKNVLRGLHLQLGESEQGQLLTVINGNVFDVCVDIRKNSHTFGQYICFDLNSDDPCQIYMPPGIAHGFCVLSEQAILHYKCTQYYSPTNEAGIIWNDPNLAIQWPIDTPIILEKDQQNLTFEEIVKKL
jgi:dTDP-4-dehydrorhamnose 3,5-epimerase